MTERGLPLCVVEVDGLLDTRAHSGDDGYGHHIAGLPVRLHPEHRLLLQRLARRCELLLIGRHSPAVLVGIATWLGLESCSTAQIGSTREEEGPPQIVSQIAGQRRLVYLGWAPSDDDVDVEVDDDLIFIRRPALTVGDFEAVDQYMHWQDWPLPRLGWYAHENDFLDDCARTGDAAVPSLPDWVVPAMRAVAPDRWSTDPRLAPLDLTEVHPAAIRPGAPQGMCVTLTSERLSVRVVTPYWDLTVSKSWVRGAEEIDNDVSDLIWAATSEREDNPGHVPGRFVVVADLDTETVVIVDATDVELESDAVRLAGRGRWRGRLTAGHMHQLRADGRPVGLVREPLAAHDVEVESVVARQLEHCMASDTTTTFGTDQLYVQVKGGPGFLHLEAVSNEFLEGENRLSWKKRRQLESLGWSKPGAIPNYVVQLVGDVDVRDAAALVCSTLRAVYGLAEHEIRAH